MKDIDTIGIRLCDEQGELFEKSLEIEKLGSASFVKYFMNSSLALEFDNLSIINEIFIPDSFINELKNKSFKHNGLRYSNNTLFWIGYIYRYWSYTYNISSKELYKMIKPITLAKYYEIYHTLDPKQAIERIIESNNLENNLNQVDLYRLIVNNN